MSETTVWTVWCPPSERWRWSTPDLNGSHCIIVGDDQTNWLTVLLLDGPRASRYWQVAPEHLFCEKYPGRSAATYVGAYE